MRWTKFHLNWAELMWSWWWCWCCCQTMWTKEKTEGKKQKTKKSVKWILIRCSSSWSNNTAPKHCSTIFFDMWHHQPLWCCLSVLLPTELFAWLFSSAFFSSPMQTIIFHFIENEAATHTHTQNINKNEKKIKDWREMEHNWIEILLLITEWARSYNEHTWTCVCGMCDNVKRTLAQNDNLDDGFGLSWQHVKGQTMGASTMIKIRNEYSMYRKRKNIAKNSHD